MGAVRTGLRDRTVKKRIDAGCRGEGHGTRERDIAREELRKKSEILAEMSVRLEALTSKSGTTSNAKQTSDLRGADPKLVTHINNLQEQLYAERNNNRRLKGG